MTGKLNFNDNQSVSQNTSATDRNKMTTESDDGLNLLGETNDNEPNADDQRTCDDEDEDVKFERYVKYVFAYKQDELALMRRRQEHVEYQLGIEKEFHKNTAEKLNESQFKVESLEAENASLKNQLALAEQKNNLCLQCDLKYTIKCRKLQFCTTACLQKMVAELKSAGLLN